MRLALEAQFLFMVASRQLLLDHVDGLINLRDKMTPEEAERVNARYEAARRRMQRELDD